MNVSKEFVSKQGQLVLQGNLKKLKRKISVPALVCIDIFNLSIFLQNTNVNGLSC